MDLLNYAMRQLERGHQPWSWRRKVFAILLPIAIIIVLLLLAPFAVPPFGPAD
jgi:hypothetical protein